MAPTPRKTIVVAMAKNRTIGIDNTLPWHLPADLKHFKALTLGHHMIMGRKTYDSIGRPLPGRTTVIVTRDPALNVEGCLIAHSLEQAVQLASADKEIFFVGGADLYRQALPLADRLRITEIQRDYDGDAHFPEFDRTQWQETARETHISDEGLEYHFVTYERRRP